ncbi:hypothetical protein ACSBR2_002308 [Camellia fascicularis]
MDLFIWNCRGAGNARFRRNLRELVRLHQPDMMVLMETKVEISTMGMFFNNLGYTASTHVDPIGRSGGIWLLWNPSQLNVRVQNASSQIITATISRQDYPDWVLSAIYASPNICLRDELWNDLSALAQHTQDPWLVAGDFNDYSSAADKRSFSSATSQNLSQSQRKSQKFSDRISSCNLMDLGCVGPRLTWTNNRKGWANTMVRLDRALCNTEWRTLFPEGYVRNLPRTYSDHSPLLIHTQGTNPSNPPCNVFKFQAAWLSHEDFSTVIENNWPRQNNNLLGNLDFMTSALQDWNKNIFGNIFRRKRWLLGRINRIQISQARTYSHNLHKLENELTTEYNRVLYQEELFWFQKSRVNWITQGERNTKFFHMSTIIKRRKIKIEVLKNEEGVWVDNPMQLKTLVHDYFQNLFAYTHTTSLEHWSNLTKHISPEDQRDMGRKSVQKTLSIHLGKYEEKTCWVEIWDVILGRTNNPDTICH